MFVLTKTVVVAAVLLLTALSPVSGAVAPEREIIPLDDPQIPLWKSHWDAGREAARQGDYASASRHYKEVISLKPQIEAAKWEYCKILYRLRDYSQLSVLLQSLIENNSHKNEYLEMAGFVSLKKKEYRQAVNYLGQVYSANPEGERGRKVLDGLVNALLGLGKDQYALPLMEQLLQRTPEDVSLVRSIAETAHEVGEIEKAKEYYSHLISIAEVTEPLLREASDVLVSAGDVDGAAEIWLKIVQKDPDSEEYQRKLYRYYLKSDQPQKALPHIMKIIEGGVENEPELLLIAGRLNFYDTGRADKALRLFERYLESMPEHHEIKMEIGAVREKIAADLLSIVENDGAEILWQDLDKITNDRLVLFNLMADKLEKAKKTNAAIEVLKIIYAQADEDSAALRLARLYSIRGDKSRSYEYYSKVKESPNLTFQYYKKKAAFENLLGLDREALITYRRMLAFNPGSLSLRMKALDLAGQLGLVREIEKLAIPVMAKKLSEEYVEFYLAYGQSLMQACKYGTAETLYKDLLKENWLTRGDKTRILLENAELYQKMELDFEQQQIYRKLLSLSSENFSAAMGLLECLLAEGALDDSWTLYKIMKKRWEKEDGNNSELLFSYIALLEADGRAAKAARELEKYLEKLRKETRPARLNATVIPSEIELCRLSIIQGDFKKCESILKRYPEDERISLSIRFLKNIVAGKGKVDVSQMIKDTMDAGNSSGGITSLFLAAELSEQFNDNEGALAVINGILHIEPHSLRANVERARLLRKNGNLAKSSQIYRKLAERYPNDVYAAKTFLELEGRRGNYVEIIKRTEKPVHPDHTVLFSLIRARALWGEERQKETLQLYKNLLEPSVNNQLQEALTRNKISSGLKAQPKKETFWGMFYYDLSNRLDNLNSMDEKDGFLSLLETKEGEIVADLYSAYRYEKVISNEYMARKAIEEKRYVAAEKQYRKSLEEDKSAEGLKDLAKIYERLGDFGKEAEVYSELEQRGESSSIIQESIERNRLSRAPTLSLDYAYFEKDGHDRAIDLEKKSGGTTFQFLPQISSSIELKYEELAYNSVSGTGSLDGRMLNASGWWELHDNTVLNFGAGYHLLDSGFDSLLVYHGRLDQQMEDQLKGYVEYRLDVVDDTLASLEQTIDVGTLKVGLVLEGESGFLVGAEYSRLSYSDNNDQNRAYAWSSYSMYSEFTTITLEYSYELLNSSVDGLLLTDSETGEEKYSLPYWSPEKYWQQLATFRFQHLLKDFETFKKNPSYYSFDVGAGFDSDENIVFSTSFDIFLEMSDNFLLKGNLHYLTTGDYDENSAGLSLLYRW